MASFFLLLIIIFFVWPLARAIFRGWQIHRQYRRAAQNLRDAFSRSRNGANPAAPKTKKKKIDPSVGEYVSYEDIACDVHTRDAASGAQTHIHAESQIEDAEWEDIK